MNLDDKFPKFDVMQRALALQAKQVSDWSEVSPCMTPNQVPQETFDALAAWRDMHAMVANAMKVPMDGLQAEPRTCAHVELRERNEQYFADMRKRLGDWMAL